MIDLSHKVALVTGGSRGVGAATARMMARAGAVVAFVYRSREEDARRVAAEITADGGQAYPLRADLSTEAGCRQTVDETVARCGGLDLFVANAGIWPADDTPVRDMQDDRWARTMAVNLDSVFFGTRAALRVIRPGGRVVIVSSTAGQRGEAFHADYAASKGAIISFVKSVAVEAAPEVTVNAVAPGWIDTEMSRGPYEDEGGEGRKRIEASIPLRRIASAEDVAGPIVFLCSDLAAQITGEIVNVNGGSVLCG